MELLEKIASSLQPATARTNAITPHVKLMSVLHMLVSGSSQSSAARLAGISQGALSGFLPSGLVAIIKLTPQYLLFPKTTQEQLDTKQGFYNFAGFPHVLGVIDCTHVQFVPAAAPSQLYVNTITQ